MATILIVFVVNCGYLSKVFGSYYDFCGLKLTFLKLICCLWRHDKTGSVKFEKTNVGQTLNPFIPRQLHVVFINKFQNFEMAELLY